MNDFNREHDSMYIQNLRKKTMQSEKMYLQMFVQIYKGLLNVGSLDDFGMLKVFFLWKIALKFYLLHFRMAIKKATIWSNARKLCENLHLIFEHRVVHKCMCYLFDASIYILEKETKAVIYSYCV